MRTFGFGAAGRAGNASELEVFAVREDGAAVGRGEERLDAVVKGDGDDDDEGAGAAVPHAVVVLFRAAGRAEDDDTDERGGNGLLKDETEEGRAPLRPTAEREDCAVDDFKRSTRLPPAPLPFTVSGDMPGRSPPGPGRAG